MCVNGRQLDAEYSAGSNFIAMLNALPNVFSGAWMGANWLTAIAMMQGVIIAVLGCTLWRQKRNQKTLQRSEDETRQIVASSPVGICVVSNRRFVYVNKAYVRMFGYSAPDEIVGRFVEELYTPEERKRQRQYAKDRPAGKPVPEIYDTKGLRKDGSHFDVEARVSLIEYNGQPSSLGFVIDRSVEKRLQRQLENANRLEAIGTLAGGIAHDFNNILTAIIGHAELATFRVGDNEVVREDLGHVRKAGLRAKDLVQQILTFSRSRETKPQLVSVSSVVREVMGLVRAALPDSIEIRASLEDDSLIYGDPTQIHQLLMNLCANAEHAMQGNAGMLEISLAGYAVTTVLAEPYPDLAPGRYLCLTVTDSGPGIPEEVIEKIFEPFFTTKEPGVGTGMGLAQVHGIVKSHGGWVRVENNVPHGARFIITLPAASACPDGDRPETTLPSGTESILVVDSDEVVAGVTSRILTDLGYSVQICRDSLLALARVTESPGKFDLVIAEAVLPVMTGEHLARAILSVCPGLPIILCSGLQGTVDEVKASRQGVRAFLEKPVSKVRLAEIVRNILDESAVGAVSLSPEECQAD